MSETRRNRDPATRETRAAGEALGPPEAAAVLPEAAAQPAAEELRQVGEAVAETVARTADAAVEMGQRVADQSREVMLLGVRAAAGMNGSIADAGLGRSHRVLGATARALDIFRQAGDSTADQMQALFAATLSVGRGMQQMQHAYIDMLDRALEHAAHKPRDLLQCRMLEELAEVQRDLYLDLVNHALQSSTTMLQLAAQTAQQAMRPLQARAAGDGAQGATTGS